MLLAYGSLYIVRNSLKGFFLIPEAVEKQGPILFDAFKHIIFRQIRWNVAGNEVRCAHQVWSLDRLIPETEVRACVATGLLGIVIEICLAVFVGMVPDDLDGVLVCTYGAIGAKAGFNIFAASIVPAAEPAPTMV